MNELKVTLGCDPEIFVENKLGEVINAEDLIPGTKHEPHPISDKGHSIQTDNIAFEFNIPASNTKEEFIDNINFVREHLSIIADSNGYRLSTKASESVNPEYLNTQQANTFGWNTAV